MFCEVAIGIEFPIKFTNEVPVEVLVKDTFEYVVHLDVPVEYVVLFNVPHVDVVPDVVPDVDVVTVE